jgi:hypothetical protein
MIEMMNAVEYAMANENTTIKSGSTRSEDWCERFNLGKITVERTTQQNNNNNNRPASCLIGFNTDDPGEWLSELLAILHPT